MSLRRYAGPLSIAAALGGFWIWILAVETLGINTRGLAGSLTMLLWSIYLLAVPLACLATILLVTVGVVRKRMPLPSAVGQVAFSCLALAFWYWSITKGEP
jgi:hypothetical protein